MPSWQTFHKQAEQASVGHINMTGMGNGALLGLLLEGLPADHTSDDDLAPANRLPTISPFDPAMMQALGALVGAAALYILLSRGMM